MTKWKCARWTDYLIDSDWSMASATRIWAHARQRESQSVVPCTEQVRRQALYLCGDAAA